MQAGHRPLYADRAQLGRVASDDRVTASTEIDWINFPLRYTNDINLTPVYFAFIPGE